MIRFLSLSLIFLSPHLQAESIWPQFRGPNGDGVAMADNVPSRFSPTENLKWRTPLPGKGWSSPVLDGDSIWVTTAIEVIPSEEEREKLLTESGADPKKFKSLQIAKHVRLLALEIGLKDGKLRREIELTVIEKPDSIHALNSYASPTPFIDEGKLYLHFGTFGTFRLDMASGAIDWQTRLPLEHAVGPGSSPLIHENLLILICDGVDQQYVTALDKHTGKEIWKKNRPEMRNPSGDRRKAYCTPIIVTPRGSSEAQLVCMGSQWLVSYRPATGEQNWTVDHGAGFSIVPRPVFSVKEQMIYVTTGFGKPELWAVDTTGKVIWKDTQRIPARPSPLLVGDELYVLTDSGIASCFNAKDGTRHYTERVGGNYSASPLFVDGKIYFCSHEGKVTVVQPGPNYEVIAENELVEQIMASPVALDGQMLLRSADALYLFAE